MYLVSICMNKIEMSNFFPNRQKFSYFVYFKVDYVLLVIQRNIIWHLTLKIYLLISLKYQKQKNLTQNSGTNERNENIGHNIGTVTQDHFEVWKSILPSLRKKIGLNHSAQEKWQVIFLIDETEEK